MAAIVVACSLACQVEKVRPVLEGPQALAPSSSPMLPLAPVTDSALRPPMGWRSENAFGCALTETDVLGVARLFTDNGMRGAGYEYLVLSCWQGPRDAAENLRADPERFPNGLAALAQQLEEAGFRLGVTAGAAGACSEAPSSRQRELEDARTLVELGVAYVDYGDCNQELRGLASVGGPDQQLERHLAYQAMRTALDATGKPVLFGVSAPRFSEWMAAIAQTWRTAQPTATTWDAIRDALEVVAVLGAYVRPGTWGDAGPIEVPPGNLLDLELLRTQLSLWAELASPLLVDAHPRDLTSDVVALLTNAEVLAINQDSRGMLGAPMGPSLQATAFSKPLEQAGAIALFLLNPTDEVSRVEVTWNDVGLAQSPALVRDVWRATDLGSFDGGFGTELEPRQSVLLRVQGNELEPPRGEPFASDLPFVYSASTFGPIERDQSNGEANQHDGVQITLNGRVFERGLGVHTGSDVRFRLAGDCERFTATIGLDDECLDSGRGARFLVFGDGTPLYQSPTFSEGLPALAIEVDVSRRQELRLFVSSAGERPLNDFSCGHVAWADARLSCRQ